jgi:hypothetical protein
MGLASRNSRIQAFAGKIEGSPRGSRNVRLHHLTNEQTRSSERDPLSESIPGCTPLARAKSPVRGYATALLALVASALSLIRCKG